MEVNLLVIVEQIIFVVFVLVLLKFVYEVVLFGIVVVYEWEQKVLLFVLFNFEFKCVQFGNGNWGIYVDLMVLFDLVFSDFEVCNVNFEDYVKSWWEMEFFVFVYSGGVCFFFEVVNGLVFCIGINYFQVNEKFIYFNGMECWEIIELVCDNQGNIIGYDMIVIVGECYKVSCNIYCMFDILFIVGYEMDMGKFGLLVNGGVYLNLFFC